MTTRTTLTGEEVGRYSRQLLMPEIGVPGQLALINSSILIVGAGGLGAPAALYLAAAGIGQLGIVDYDVVELNNLHRQVIHNQERVGMMKSESARITVNSLNALCKCIPYHVALTPENAMDIIREYDIVLDCTDNAATRYLLNDACVLSGKPLVSGSALRMEGQLTVYNFDGSPCYRCLFPTPPPAASVTNCGDGGVLGCVPGMIGCLQAMEAMKIAICLAGGNNRHMEVCAGKMLLFDGMRTSIRTVKLRQRRTDCVVCGDQPSVRHLIDYEEFCGSRACDKTAQLQILDDDERISVQEYNNIVTSQEPHVLLDVRQQQQFDICSLPNSINIPLEQLTNRTSEVQQYVSDGQAVYVVCRRGNRSQQAVRILQSSGLAVPMKDIVGGITAWHHEIDQEFPLY